jgi:hypothetical protein
MRVLVLMFAAGLLSGTGTAMANPAHKAIAAMDEPERQKTFGKLMLRSGESCPKVERTFYQGADRKGNAYWNMQCSPGESFLVQVNNDATGSTRIMKCRQLEAINGARCFTKFQ